MKNSFVDWGLNIIVMVRRHHLRRIIKALDFHCSSIDIIHFSTAFLHQLTVITKPSSSKKPLQYLLTRKKPRPSKKAATRATHLSVAVVLDHRRRNDIGRRWWSDGRDCPVACYRRLDQAVGEDFIGVMMMITRWETNWGIEIEGSVCRFTAMGLYEGIRAWVWQPTVWEAFNC